MAKGVRTRGSRRFCWWSSTVNLSDLRSTGVPAVVRRELRPWFSELRRLYFNKIWGMDIAPGCRICASSAYRGRSCGKSSSNVTESLAELAKVMGKAKD
jgi:hypothetical protein